MKNRFETKYKLFFVQKFLIGFFLLMGITSFFIHKTAYAAGCVNERINYFDVLHKGDYEVKVSYNELPEDAELVIYTEDMADEYNKANMEIARKDLPSGSGEIQTQIHIARELRRIFVVTSLDTEDYSYITESYVNGCQLFDYDNYYIGLLFVLCAILIWMLGCYVDYRKYYKPAILLGIGLLVSFPLFSDFLISVQGDLEFHFARINGIYHALCAGEFPVRVNPIQVMGLGNISATMYPSFFLYPVSIMHMLGMSVVLGYKLLLTACNMATAVFSFYSVKNMCKSEKAGWFAAFFYTFSLYRLNNMYVRGALGETLAMTFFPLVMWGTAEVLFGNRKKWYVLMMGMTGVIESHVLSMEVCVVFILLQGILFLFSKADAKGERIVAGLKAAMGTILLNLSFLLTFLTYAKEAFTVFHYPSRMYSSAVYFSQMFTLFSNTQGVNCGRGFTKGEMPLTIGAALAVPAFMVVIGGGLLKTDKKKLAIGRTCLVWGSVALYAASWLFPWELFERNPFWGRIVATMQFPWRLLGPASAFFCVAAAVAMEMLLEQERFKWVANAILVLSVISVCYFFDNMVMNADTINKIQAEASRTFDYLYMYAEQVDLSNTTTVYETADRGAEFLNYEKSGSSVEFDIYPADDNDEENYLVFPLYYYPGYEITVNGHKVDVCVQNDRVSCRVPEEVAHVQASFRGKTIFRVADIVSTVGAVFVILYIVSRMLFIQRKEKGSGGQ